mmetsp:Transcript_36141/g.76138  ORF Transcript_36141/g.76138 Transcript_36141/m.76138 type:complete len:89 (+) Transcript_36141:211-477(+)
MQSNSSIKMIPNKKYPPPKLDVVHPSFLYKQFPTEDNPSYFFCAEASIAINSFSFVTQPSLTSFEQTASFAHAFFPTDKMEYNNFILM